MFSGDLDFWPFALDCKPCYLNVVLFWALPQGTFIFSITTTFSFSLPVWWDGNGSSFPKGGCLHGECLLLWYILEQLFRVLFSLVFVLCYLLPYKKKKKSLFFFKEAEYKMSNNIFAYKFKFRILIRSWCFLSKMTHVAFVMCWQSALPLKTRVCDVLLTGKSCVEKQRKHELWNDSSVCDKFRSWYKNAFTEPLSSAACWDPPG